MVQHPYVLIYTVLFKGAFTPLLKCRVGLMLSCCFSQDVFLVGRLEMPLRAIMNVESLLPISEQYKQ